MAQAKTTKDEKTGKVSCCLTNKSGSNYCQKLKYKSLSICKHTFLCFRFTPEYM